MSSITPDILVFDVVNPLHYCVSDSERKRAQEWFSSFQGPIGYEIRALFIASGDDVALATTLTDTAEPGQMEGH